MGSEMCIRDRGCADGAAGRSKGLICLRLTWMEDAGGKSGRRPARHLQVEASGPRSATSVRQRLAGRFRGGEIAQGRTCAVWPKVDAPELSSGPVCEIQEVSRVGAQGVTSKSKLLALDDTIAQWRLAGRFRGGEIDQGRTCAVWLQVGAPELSSGPVGEIQEVSRVGVQGVTSKSKLLARQMPRVCSLSLIHI